MLSMAEKNVKTENLPPCYMLTCSPLRLSNSGFLHQGFLLPFPSTLNEKWVCDMAITIKYIMDPKKTFIIILVPFSCMFIVNYIK